MGNLIYLVVAVLLNAWIIGFLGYSAGILIHILLFLAVFVIAYRAIKDRKLSRELIPKISKVRKTMHFNF
ncbi:MAG: lmo0937 family membrane protein [Saprospiraceae bacterium]